VLPLNSFNDRYYYVSEDIQKMVQLILQKVLPISEGLVALEKKLMDMLEGGKEDKRKYMAVSEGKQGIHT
jgi:hypothetical protein